MTLRVPSHKKGLFMPVRLSVRTNSLGHPVGIRLPRGKERRVIWIHGVWEEEDELHTGYRIKRRLHDITISGLGRNIIVLDQWTGDWEMRQQ